MHHTSSLRKIFKTGTFLSIYEFYTDAPESMWIVDMSREERTIGHPNVTCFVNLILVLLLA